VKLRTPVAERIPSWLASAAYWLLPPLFCLILYWPGLKTWFLDDDFAWLQLRWQVHSWQDLWRALFTPTRHGTFRPLSERAFFLIFGSLSFSDALPFRICAFGTQFVNLALVSSITRRLTGSRLAGFWAPVFWTANSNLVSALIWTSAYMQILCGLVLLLAFHFLLRSIETGKRRYRWLQWVPYLAGFGVMETNLVYPALAASYTWLCAREHFRKTLPLFVPSVAFVIFHMIIAPKRAAGLYSLHFDSALLTTLATYWRWSLEPRNLSIFTRFPGWVGPAGVALFTIALAGFALWALRQKNRLPLVFAFWFLILLAPVLPLREQRSPYYLTLPAMALGMLAASALAAAWQARRGWRIAGALAAGAFLVVFVPCARGATTWDYRRSQEVKTVVLGVVRARELHPRQAILLTGVTDRLFWSALWDGAFKAMQVPYVYVDPDAELHIRLRADVPSIAETVLPAELIAPALDQSRLVVYQVGGPRLRNITSLYRSTLKPPAGGAVPRRLDVGNPLASHLLGPTWYSDDGGYRWMPASATVRIGGPRSPGQRLYLSGYRSAELAREGPVHLTVSVEGEALPPVEIRRGDLVFSFDFPLPEKLVGRPSIQVEVRVDRTFSPGGEQRRLGLAFGVFEVR